MVVADLGVALEPRRRACVTGIIGQRHALMAQPPQAVGQLRIVGGDHAALGGSDDLARMQAEYRHIGQRPHRPAPVEAAEGAGGIVQHPQPVPAGQSTDRVDVAWQPELIDRHDHPRSVGDSAGGAGGIDVIGGGVDLGKDRGCADMPDDIDRSDKSKRRDDHLVAGADTPSMQHQKGAGRPARDPDRVIGAAQPSKAPLEFRQARPAHYPAAAHHRRGGFRFGLTKAGAAERDGLVHPRTSAGRRQLRILSSRSTAGWGWVPRNQSM